MNMVQLINKKRLQESFSFEEIEFIVNGYVSGEIPDYQMSSLLMAVVLNGMNDQEIVSLTKVMIGSGETIDLSNVSGNKVDKHSTGGVGDKVTLILSPILASLHIKVPKMSGRGLGHTGGTIDKLESIPGFQVDLTLTRFKEIVNEIGMCVVGQTGNLVPADKKIYALRDVTGTVSSIPLIASSIMSKKIASGADTIILDVKVGKGALLDNLEEARELSRLMVLIGTSFGKKVICALTNMEEPLGNSVGNALEVLESMEVLQGDGPTDLRELVVSLATLVVEHEFSISKEEAREKVEKVIASGEAYQKFLEFVKIQNGQIDKLEVSSRVISVTSPKDGVITKIDALKIGDVVRRLGAGRMKKEDKVNYGVGIVLQRKVGEYVFTGDELVRIYLGEKDLLLSDVLSCFEIESELRTKEPLIYEIIQ